MSFWQKEKTKKKGSQIWIAKWDNFLYVDFQYFRVVHLHRKGLVK
jgi:hypothetical protein